ncbi:hypothetical protein [Natrinema altunense]|uniref:Uncharacterized protein n=1 Tax=Natrinema altunense TaxID=222984 RepID=A0A482Y192_9EURY|nr:hypothetical protein [Natrinema altunense]RZH66527.1 hypothetical protein ELS17_17850 [Natrinema altunense]
MTKYVDIGEDKTFNNAEDGAKDSTGMGGIGNRQYDYELSDNRAMAAAVAYTAGDTGCWAETWTKVYIRNPQPGLGDWSQQAKITVDGFWSAFLEATVSGTEIKLEAFIRDSSDNLDSSEVLHKTSEPADLWSDNDSYTEDLYAELETSNAYEIGIRAKASATAITQISTGLADCYSSDTTFEYAGRHEYDSLELTWL